MGRSNIFYSPIPRLIRLVCFGPETENGTGVVHGGALATVLDVIMISVKYVLIPFAFTLNSWKIDIVRRVTVTLHIDYQKAVPVGDLVLMEAWLEKEEGRKKFVRAKISDGKGNTYCTANAVFVDLNSKL